MGEQRTLDSSLQRRRRERAIRRFRRMPKISALWVNLEHHIVERQSLKRRR